MMPIKPIHCPTATLEKVPSDVKKMILNCLNFQEITSATGLNKSWQNMVNDKHVWLKKAQQITKENITPENAHDHCLYSYINREFYKILTTNWKNPHGRDELIIKELDSCNSELEKYKLLKNYLKKHRKPIQLYICNISNIKLTANEVSYVKKVIVDFVLDAEASSVKEVHEGIELSYDNVTRAIALFGLGFLCHSNLELFKFTLERLKVPSRKHLDIFRLATRYFAKLGFDSAAPCIKILLNEGVRPDEFALVAVINNNHGQNLLKIFLAYSGDSVRNRVLSKLKHDLDKELQSIDNTYSAINDANANGYNTLAFINSRVQAREKYEKQCVLINSVPAPPDTCCVIL